jgi:tRNA(adenine34) deaminase
MAAPLTAPQPTPQGYAGFVRARAASAGGLDALMMQRALNLARRAGARGEVPVGAILARGEKVVASAGNRRERSHDATSHAELLTLRAAGMRLRGWRLTGLTLYVTLEPCVMCAGAAILARISRLVFGAWDPKAGAAGSLFDIPRDARLNHRMEVSSGVLADECAEVLRAFFKERRATGRSRAD